MDDKCMDLLVERIEKEFNELETKNGSAKGDSIEGIRKLYELKLEEDRILNENEDIFNKKKAEEQRFIKETELKEKQIKEQRIGTVITAGTTFLSTIFGLLAYNHWFKKGLKFEETGTVTTPMTKNLISKLLPKK